MRLCGISSRFQLLSPGKRQVPHALLTRPPLSKARRLYSVRLACVRHAASVNPEPGSNSHVKISSRSEPSSIAGFLVLPVTYCVRTSLDVREFLMEPHLFRADVLEKRSETSFKRIFRDWLYCSIIKDRCCLSDSSVIIPPPYSYVKRFSRFLKKFLQMRRFCRFRSKLY